MRLELIPEVLRAVQHGPHRSIIDLGMKEGFWGAAIRRFVDEGPRPWKVWLVGCEADKHRYTPAWDLYDERILIAPEKFPGPQQGPRLFDVILAMESISSLPEDARQHWIGNVSQMLNYGGRALLVDESGSLVEIVHELAGVQT